MSYDEGKVKEMLKARGRSDKGRRGEGHLMQSPDTRAPESSAHDGMHAEGKKMAAQEMIDAFHAKDVQKAHDAMSAFMDLHAAQGNKPSGKVTGDDL